MSEPLVSVITPSFNSLPYIAETFASLLSQTMPDWEWVVTDDFSDDGSYEYLISLADSDDRVRVFRQSDNFGAARARNNSIAHARGKFLAFLDSDDLWLPEKLASQLQYMGEQIDFCFTPYEVVDSENKKTLQIVDLNNTGVFTYEDMLKKKATLGCSTVILRRNAFKFITMPDIRTGQDYGLWLSLLRSGKSAVLFNRIMTRYRISPSSISRNKFRKARSQWNIYRRIEKIPLAKAVLCFCFYGWRAIFRR